MKKILLIAAAALISSASFAQSQYGFTTITPGAGQYFLATAMSDNGKYIAGSLGQDTGSGLYDVENEKFYYYSGHGDSEMSAVTNGGMLVGYGYSANTLLAVNPITGEEIIDSSVTDLWGKDCTPDGSLIIGTFWDSAWKGHAGYWKDGNACLKLTEPDAEEIEFGFIGDDDDPADWGYQYTEAVGVSEDGSVIVGNVYSWVLNSGALIWRLDDEGEYILDPICAGKVETDYGTTHPYIQYASTAVSPNGKYVAMYLQDNDGGYGGVTYMGRYDVETGELETAALESDCSPSRIANDGTIVGWTGDLISQSREPLIWEPGSEIEYITEKYSKAKEFEEWNADGWSFPCDITPDGRYIAGGGWHYFEGEADTYSRWASWLFDREMYTTGIHEVRANSDVSGGATYYSIDGKKLNAPQKGLNIVRADGKVHKVVIK